jgi:hypothetical protein
MSVLLSPRTLAAHRAPDDCGGNRPIAVVHHGCRLHLAERDAEERLNAGRNGDNRG